MVNINLLPWRHYDAVYQKKRIKQTIVFSSVLTSFFIFLVHIFLSKQVENTQKSVLHLQATVEQQRLVSHASISAGEASHTEKRALSRQHTHVLLQALLKQSHAGVCFTGMMQHGNRVSFRGEVRTAADLSDFLTHWPGARLFSRIHIVQLRDVPAQQTMQFQLQAIEEASQA